MPAVGSNQLFLTDDPGQCGRSRRVEQRGRGRQAEGDGVYGDGVAGHQREYGGQGGSGKVRAHQNPHSGQAVDEGASKRCQQQHGKDLRDNDGADAQPAAGQLQDQQRERDRVEDVTALRCRAGGPQAPVLAVGKNRAQPRPHVRALSSARIHHADSVDR